MSEDNEAVFTPETETVTTLPCFRIVTLEEIDLLETSGVLTRAIQDRDDSLPPNRKQDKLEDILVEYFERHLPDSHEAENLIEEETDKVEFIAKGLSLVTD